MTLFSFIVEWDRYDSTTEPGRSAWWLIFRVRVGDRRAWVTFTNTARSFVRWGSL